MRVPVEGLSVVFEVLVSNDLGGCEARIVGVNGKFDIELMTVFLQHASKTSYVQVTIACQGKPDNSWHEVEIGVMYTPSETQYGSGFGDVLTLPAYYGMGNIIGSKEIHHTFSNPVQEEDV